MAASAWNRATLTLFGARRHDVDAPLTAFLDQIEATPLCRIGVFGPGAGEALPRLWRRGYARAQAGRCGHPAPRDGEVLHDAVWVSESACADSALKSVVNALPGLRAGGEIVVELDRMGGDEASALQRGLESLGLRAVRALQPRHHAVVSKVEHAEVQVEASMAARG